MLTMKNTGLVQGVPLEEEPTMVRIRAVRGFYDQDGKPRTPGDILEVKQAFANYLVQTNKAVLMPGVEVVAIETVPPSPEPEPAQVAGDPAPAVAEEEKPRRRRSQ